MSLRETGFNFNVMRMNDDTGEVEFDGKTHVPGMRCVWTEDEIAGGPRYYVIRVPRHSYGGLASRQYAATEFIVYEAAYTETAFDRDQRAADAPAIRVRKLVRFPAMAGTKVMG